MRLDIRRIGSGKDKSGEAINNKVKIKVVKNKLAPPFKICEAVIDFENGFDTIGNLFDCLLNNQIIKKSGSWFSINEEQLGQGREASVEALGEYSSEKLGELYSAVVDGLQEKQVENKPKKKKKRKRKR